MFLRTGMGPCGLGNLVEFICPCRQKLALCGLGSQGASRCPCGQEWALYGMGSRGACRCPCRQEWALSGRENWVASRCPCVGYFIGKKMSVVDKLTCVGRVRHTVVCVVCVDDIPCLGYVSGKKTSAWAGSLVLNAAEKRSLWTSKPVCDTKKIHVCLFS